MTGYFSVVLHSHPESLIGLNEARKVIAVITAIIGKYNI